MLTGLTPSTLYTLVMSANFKKVDSFEYQVQKSQEEVNSTLVMTLNKTVYHKQKTANNDIPVYAFGKGGNFDQYPTIKALFESLQPDYDYVSHTVIAERSEDNAGWRESDIGTVTYEKKITTYVDKFTVVGSITKYDTYEAAKAAIESSFDMTNFDSKLVSDENVFTGDLRKVTITATKNYTSESVSAFFTTKAWSTIKVNFVSSHSSHDPISVTYDETTINSPSPTHADFHFLGWFMDDEYVTPFTNSVAYENAYDQAKEVTVYAKWAPKVLSKFVVNFFDNIDNTVKYDSIELTYETKTFKMPDEPEKTGFDFGGWMIGESSLVFDKNYVVVYGNKYEDDKEIDVYAKWVEKDASKYTINFYQNDELEEPLGTSIMYYNDVDFDFPKEDPTEETLNFIGWFYMDGDEEKEFTEEFEVVYDGPYDGDTVLNVYAKWVAKPLSTFTINFDAAGGSTVESIVLVHPQTNFEVPSTTRPGFTFDGWFIDGGEVEFDEDYEVAYDGVYEDDLEITVIARWTVIPVQPPTEQPTTEEPPTSEPTTAATTEDLEDEPVALGEGIDFVDVDQYLGAPVVEIFEEIDFEEPTPLGSTLPQTGQLPAELFYGLGGLVTAAGAFLRRKK
ncbi:MAG TPA: hypothetical protein DCS67_03710 [Clostridiales bacterium UBA8960]|nr:hypothetical protein [Clostridiales bacterium UBA8960]